MAHPSEGGYFQVSDSSDPDREWGLHVHALAAFLVQAPQGGVSAEGAS